MLSFSAARAYLESCIDYEKISHYAYSDSLKLENLTLFLNQIGNPQSRLRFLHVAGSKGKGSTCMFMCSILRQAGYSVGLYTSPHLHDIRERIRILKPNSLQKIPLFEGMISRADFSKEVSKLKKEISVFTQKSAGHTLTFFEALTALAFSYFFRKKVDVVVLETGLGGRLDATNTQIPLATILTPISLEHTDKLGKTIEAIAHEKAGIIKKGVRVCVSALQPEAARKVFEKTCKKLDVPFMYVDPASVFSPGTGRRHDISSGMKGAYQRINAATAVSAIKALDDFGIKVTKKNITAGIQKALWPGRFEIVGAYPEIVLDGAHNQASARALRISLQQRFQTKKFVIIFGASDDKDVMGIAHELKLIASWVILTRSDNVRSAEPQSLRHYFSSVRTSICDDVQSALICAKAIRCPGEGILITGSLFVVAQARDVLGRIQNG